MHIDVLYRPAHTLAKVRLASGETLEAEAGAMVGMSPNVQMTTSAGGAMKGLKRLFGGESFFRNQFTAQSGPGEVLLAPALCGDMTVLDLGPSPWFIQSSSYIGAPPSVQLETKVGGLRTFFAGEGLFVLRASGTGQVIVGAFGGLEPLDVDGEVTIDTGHLVAWQDTPGLTYRVGKAGGGWIASFLSGEGLVCKFSGRGRVWIQSRNPAEYGSVVGALLPPRQG